MPIMNPFLLDAAKSKNPLLERKTIFPEENNSIILIVFVVIIIFVVFK